MKRSLPVVNDATAPAVRAPSNVIIEGQRVSVYDAGDGGLSLGFVEQLIEAGAKRVGSADDTRADICVVIRGPLRTPEARRDAEALEGVADVVLGSARPAFARVFASACARWVNS